MTKAEIVVQLYSVWLKNWFDLNKTSAWPSQNVRTQALNTIIKDSDLIVEKMEAHERETTASYQPLASEDGRPF